jgi:arylsulfatase A-like enzyme
MVHPAAEWMAKAKRPFFAMMLTVSTHHPYDSPGAGPARSWQMAQQHYERAARYVDDQLRMLFQQLEHDGTLANTIVIVMGDHGEAFDEKPGFRQHDRAPYDNVTRVPLFIYAPQLFQPQHLSGLRQQTDILPTVLELAHLSWKGQLPGSSLFSTPGHSYIISSCWYPNSCLSLRSENHSFVFHFGHLPLQAFDLATDPEQQHDVAALVPLAVQDQAIDLMLGEMASVRRYYESAYPDNDPDH